jgi:HSP20 family protein
MANITNYRPNDVWGGLDPFASPLDDLIRGFFVKPVSREGRVWSGTPLRVDVSESEKEYRVIAEMPGVRKEDINVSINGNEVAISAEVKNEKEAKDGEKTLRTERYYGKLYRAFTLEHPVDEANAQARYADGVLELTLPKSEAAMPKRIAVH